MRDPALDWQERYFRAADECSTRGLALAWMIGRHGAELGISAALTQAALGLKCGYDGEAGFAVLRLLIAEREKVERIRRTLGTRMP